MVQRDPLTGTPWKDRYGVAFGKKLKKTGNVEAFLNYGKLHRTGNLLRRLTSKTSGKDIILNNSARYAEDHEEGSVKSGVAKIKEPYVRGGANTVVTGGKITARPFMNPSKKILKMPSSLLEKKLRSFGWKT